MIEESYASNYLPIIANFLQGKQVDFKSFQNPEKEKSSSENSILTALFNNGMYQISDYGYEVAPEKAPENSVAIISISDVITKYDQNCGPSGMKTKADILTRCYNNPNIKGIVLSIDSGGGEGLACNLLQETISKRNKGVAAFVDDFACSAAYGIAAACDTVTLNSKMARVGSIGSYFTIADYSKYYENLGINLIDIYASKSTDKNRDYFEAIKGNTEPLKKVCDIYNENFIASIANYRKGRISEDQSQWNTGKIFFAEDAIKLGLADEIASLTDVVNYFNT